MEKQWFVLHTLTGQENKVKKTIEAQARLQDMQDLIGEVLIPTEKVSDVKKGVKTTVTRKFFPGYVLINMVLYDEDGQINHRSWHFIREIQGVIGFVGSEKPAPMSRKELDDIFTQVEDKQARIKPKVVFEAGESVKITDGPFLNFNGIVDEVDPGRGKLKVSVAIFGRSAPVELEYWQVEKD